MAWQICVEIILNRANEEEDRFRLKHSICHVRFLLVCDLNLAVQFQLYLVLELDVNVG